MPPVVCVHTEIPTSDQTVDEGVVYSCYFNIKNCGSERGNFYYGIEKDGVGCKAEYNVSLNPGEIGYQLTCSFTMPSKDVKIRYFAGYADPGWVEKYSHEVTIHVFKRNPKADFINESTACGISDGVNYVHPGGSLDVVQGTKLYAKGRIKNIGTGSGKLQLWPKNITNNKYECQSIKTDTAVNGWYDHSCSFTMPDHDVVIELQACHYENSTPYIYDKASRITLRRKAPPKPEFAFINANCFMYWDGASCYKDVTKNVPVGASVGAQARIKNVGSGAGAPTLKIYHGTTKLCERTGASLDPGEWYDLSKSGCFTMPNANRDIVMKVYYGARLDDTVGCGMEKKKEGAKNDV